MKNNAENHNRSPDPDDETGQPETAPNPVASNSPPYSHVDDFIYDAGNDDPPDAGEANYARWLLLHFRLPAFMLMNFSQFIADHNLFCTYEGKRYRCTGGSRMGDVWLASDFTRDTGYDLRVDVAKCKQWSAKE